MKKYLILMNLILFIISSGFSQQNEGIKIRKQEKDSPISIQVKDGAQPDVYIDGKKYDADIIGLLDQNLIATMNVIKGEEAMDLYNAPNGVIIIVSKNKAAASNMSFTIGDDKSKLELQDDTDNSKKPLLIVDGKEWHYGTLKKLDPNDIATIDVIKGDKAMKKYKAPNGVIIVKTKK